MATAANQLIKAREPASRRPFPVLTAKRLYQGTLVFLASGLATDVINAGANKFAGVTPEEVDNSAGASGDKTVEPFTRGVFYLPGSGFSQATVGSKIYASDNFTVTTTAASMSFIGTCVEYVSATLIGVELEINID